LDEIFVDTLSTLFAAGPGRFWAKSAQKQERESEAKFCFFWSGTQRAISPTSRRPNFMEFANKTWIGEVVNHFGTKF